MEELTKEELIQTPKKKHRWIFMVYSVLCILFTVNCFLFITPLRLYLWLMLIIYWIIWIVYKKTRILQVTCVSAGVIITLLSGFLYVYLNIYFSYRHPWQYEKDMAPYSQSFRHVSYFPETIPECASKVAFSKGYGYIILSFIADDTYIQACKDKHTDWLYEYNDIHPESWPEDFLSEFTQNACVDLYPLYEEELNRRFTPDAMKALSISDKEARKTVKQWLLPDNVHLTDKELSSAKQYHICKDHGQGFIIVEDTNRIIFYRDFNK